MNCDSKLSCQTFLWKDTLTLTRIYTQTFSLSYSKAPNDRTSCLPKLYLIKITYEVIQDTLPSFCLFFSNTSWITALFWWASYSWCFRDSSIGCCCRLYSARLLLLAISISRWTLTFFTYIFTKNGISLEHHPEQLGPLFPSLSSMFSLHILYTKVILMLASLNDRWCRFQ